MAVLRTHRARQLSERLAVGDAWEDSGLVFATRDGGPIHPRNDYRSFQRLLAQAGIRRVRVHDLRHTAASLLRAQGVDARTVMEVLGHSQVDLTLNVYTHVPVEATRAALASLADGLIDARAHDVSDVPGETG